MGDSALKSIFLLRDEVGHHFGAGGSAPPQAVSAFANSTFTQWSELEIFVFKAYTVDPVYGQPACLVTLEPAYNEAGELVAVRKPRCAPAAPAAAANELSLDFIALATEQLENGGAPKLT